MKCTMKDIWQFDVYKSYNSSQTNRPGINIIFFSAETIATIWTFDGHSTSRAWQIVLILSDSLDPR